MIRVTVQRAPANRQGPDISDALITSELVAVERGRNAIDEQSTARTIVTLDVVPVVGVRINRLAEVQDLATQPWRGLLTGVKIVDQRDDDTRSQTMVLTVEREAL